MLGTPLIHFEVTDSTNREAKTLAADGAVEGTAVTAGFQTAGRGRHDRVWLADAGKSLLVSFILRPQRAIEEWPGLSLVAGLAVHDAIEGLGHADLSLKWPNDVLIGGSKVAGILLESGGMGTNPFVIAGIGVNLNQEAFEGDFMTHPTSLLLASGRMTAAGTMLQHVSTYLTEWYGAWTRDGMGAIIPAWRKRCRLFGRRARIREREELGEVCITDLREDGALMVATDSGDSIAILAGDLVLPAGLE